MSAGAAEKRHSDETLSATAEEPRKKKIDGDVPSSVVAEILEVTSDPKKMLGPDVSIWYSAMNMSKHFGTYFTTTLDGNVNYLLLSLLLLSCSSITNTQRRSDLS